MSTVPRISAREAFAKMTDEGYRYVDVRTPEEFALGHPEGAINVPLLVLDASGTQVDNPDFVRSVEEAFARDEPLVLGCRSGKRSARAASLLASAGFTKVCDQRAGWDGTRGPFGEVVEEGWLGAGLPRIPT